MSNVKHTPGPWIAFYEHHAGPMRVGAGTNCTVAAMYQPPVGDMLANARLVAAAPELLEFVQEFLNDYRSEDGMGSMKHYAGKAFALIEKATGEQP